MLGKLLVRKGTPIFLGENTEAVAVIRAATKVLIVRAATGQRTRDAVTVRVSADLNNIYHWHFLCEIFRSRLAVAQVRPSREGGVCVERL